jgi:hypothetical protein
MPKPKRSPAPATSISIKLTALPSPQPIPMKRGLFHSAIRWTEERFFTELFVDLASDSREIRSLVSPVPKRLGLVVRATYGEEQFEERFLEYTEQGKRRSRIAGLDQRQQSVMVFEQDCPVGERELVAMSLGNVLAVIAEEQLNSFAEFARVRDQQLRRVRIR